MTEASGGEPVREGMSYQDLAAATFFVTDELGLEEEPLKLHIERNDADFSFVIHTDDYSKGHYFESKYRGAGKIQWASDFRDDIFEEFADIHESRADHNDINFYHLVTNVDLDRSAKSLIEDAGKIRGRDWTWETFETRHERKNLNPLEDRAEYDDYQEFANLIAGLTAHTPTEGELEAKLEKYIKKCSPGSYTTPMETILEKVSSVSGGVIRLRDLEDAVGFKLEPTSSSTSVSSSDLLGKVKQTADRRGSGEFSSLDIRREKQEVEELGDRAAEGAEFPEDAAIESQVTSISEHYEELVDAKQRVDKLEGTIHDETDDIVEIAEETLMEDNDD